MRNVWIGTSGWIYKGWRGTFYPEQLPLKKWLNWYTGQFSSTEINGSFYRTPTLEAVRSWRDAAPDDFVFAWKASRFITHWKRLTEKCVNSLELMETRLKALEPKVGPILFQLPPQFRADRERLASFLGLLNRKRLYTFEFRHESWYDDSILKLLRSANVSLCLSDHHDAPSPWEATASHVYIRGHGPTGRYKDRYPKKTLGAWKASIRSWRRRRLKVYCYFDNDQKTAAPRDARRMMELLDSKEPSRSQV